MVAQSKARYISPGEYLEWEETQEARHEYHNGTVAAMSGGTHVHSLISSNIVVNVGFQLKQTASQIHGSGLRVRVYAYNRYFYPDVMVICGPPSYTDNRQVAVDNPNLVIEVLSESTEHFDRTTKMDCYAELPSLHTYVLVSQSEPRIELFTRTPDRSGWKLTVYTGTNAVVPLREIGCTLRASEVYDRIEFSETPHPPTDNQSLV